MQVSRRNVLKLGGIAAALASVGEPALAWQSPFTAPPRAALTPTPAWHLVSRIGWGARPEEVAHAEAVGLEAYLEEQLHPERLDDSALDTRLAALPILTMDRRSTYRLANGDYRCYKALLEGMVLRAVYSKRQLYERMVEFWSDHFNIASDERSRDLVVFQREVIRKHALGRFRDLLFGSAQSPAMLYYLDNAQNAAAHPNENYARELLELHTLGVDGGYSEQDVRETARALTGWTVDDRTESGFSFHANMHDHGEKTILGHTLVADRGIEDGLQLLGILANHASTARFVCHKLCVRFVRDDPPASLVEGAAAVWSETQGDITAVLRHILLASDFYAAQGQKLRRPLDFLVAALRATGTEIGDFWTLESLMRDLAQVPYGWHPPDGYPDVARAWMTSSGLLARWNVAFALTHGAYSDPDSPMTNRLAERTGPCRAVGELVDAVAGQVFATPLPPDARAAFVAYVTDDIAADMADNATGATRADTPLAPHLHARKLGSLYGLMVASPLYQWR